MTQKRAILLAIAVIAIVAAVVYVGLWGAKSPDSSAADVASQLDSALEGIARKYAFEPLRPPLGGLTPPFAYDERTRRVLRSCWRADTVPLQSLVDETITGADRRGTGASAKAGLLGRAGINISSQGRAIRQVELTLSDWSVATADQMRFVWADPACWAEVRAETVPVVQALLRFGSMKATLITENGQQIALDSATLKASPGIDVAVSGDWHLERTGRLTASGKGLAVGVTLVRYDVQEFRCPATGGLVLTSGGPFTRLHNCPGVQGETAWYRLRARQGRGDTVWLDYQGVGPGAGGVQTVAVMLGTQFALDTLPRRLDLATLDLESAGRYELTVTRYDLAPPQNADSILRVLRGVAMAIRRPDNASGPGWRTATIARFDSASRFADSVTLYTEMIRDAEPVESEAPVPLSRRAAGRTISLSSPAWWKTELVDVRTHAITLSADRRARLAQ